MMSDELLRIRGDEGRAPNARYRLENRANGNGTSSGIPFSHSKC